MCIHLMQHTAVKSANYPPTFLAIIVRAYCRYIVRRILNMGDGPQNRLKQLIAFSSVGRRTYCVDMFENRQDLSMVWSWSVLVDIVLMVLNCMKWLEFGRFSSVFEFFYGHRVAIVTFLRKDLKVCILMCVDLITKMSRPYRLVLRPVELFNCASRKKRSG